MEEKFEIGVSGIVQSAYTDITNVGFRDAAEPLGVKIRYAAPPRGDVKRQRELLENKFLDVDQPVDGLAVVAADTDLLREPITRALEMNIPVICVDLDAPASGRYLYVGTETPDLLGRMAGEEMVDRLDGEGSVAVQTGSLDAPGAASKMKGFEEIIEPTDVEIVTVENDGVDNELALEQSRTILEEYAIDGFYGVYARNAPLQAKAVTERDDADDVTIVGFDMLPATAEYIERGVIDASIWIKEYYFGYYSSIVLHHMIEFGIEETLELLRFNGDEPSSNTFRVPSLTVTSDNVDNFFNWAADTGALHGVPETAPLPKGINF